MCRLARAPTAFVGWAGLVFVSCLFADILAEGCACSSLKPVLQ